MSASKEKGVLVITLGESEEENVQIPMSIPGNKDPWEEKCSIAKMASTIFHPTLDIRFFVKC